MVVWGLDFICCTELPTSSLVWILSMVPSFEHALLLIQDQLYWNKSDCGPFEGKEGRAAIKKMRPSTWTCRVPCRCW